MRSSSGAGGFNINVRTQKLEVDNRISLRYYYRIADNLLKQADIFRAEKNIIDLYVMLMRFSSLITETIPLHRDFKASLQREKLSFKKKLLNALSELEKLKPAVNQKIEELNRKQTNQVDRWGHNHQNGSFDSLLEWPAVKKKTQANYEIRKMPQSIAREVTHQSSRSYQFSNSRPVEGQFHKLSLNIPRPKEETLSRHSILGPNGLRGQWQPPSTKQLVQYPSNLDLTPIEIPSLEQPVKDELTIQKEGNSLIEKSTLEAVLFDDHQSVQDVEPPSLISLDTVETPVHTDIVRQPSPPPVLVEVQDLSPTTSPQIPESGCAIENSFQDELARSKSPLELHISTTMMENFMRLAKSNTQRNLETCGVLAGSLKNRKFYITALIIPKQESTSDSCQTTNEEEIFDVQDKQSLFPLGWIHVSINDNYCLFFTLTKINVFDFYI
ncbi:AMSH-like ubiquitin thioesterase 1 [Telopea speciosissima]|uniref:AMSH-like ubiquitin thioesterase 1 n=1 Tax=Telopea speciosissima TaxID=54955 RepID=UPI001CC48195|nr:AMSH-like ubiquitin thioesterase 1 [Telopea speciosissima]